MVGQGVVSVKNTVGAVLVTIFGGTTLVAAVEARTAAASAIATPPSRRRLRPRRSRHSLRSRLSPFPATARGEIVIDANESPKRRRPSTSGSDEPTVSRECAKWEKAPQTRSKDVLSTSEESGLRPATHGFKRMCRMGESPSNPPEDGFINLRNLCGSSTSNQKREPSILTKSLPLLVQSLD